MWCRPVGRLVPAPSVSTEGNSQTYISRSELHCSALHCTALLCTALHDGGRKMNFMFPRRIGGGNSGRAGGIGMAGTGGAPAPPLGSSLHSPRCKYITRMKSKKRTSLREVCSPLISADHSLPGEVDPIMSTRDSGTYLVLNRYPAPKSQLHVQSANSGGAIYSGH
jgi:hypothetical protein